MSGVFPPESLALTSTPSAASSRSSTSAWPKAMLVCTAVRDSSSASLGSLPTARKSSAASTSPTRAASIRLFTSGGSCGDGAAPAPAACGMRSPIFSETLRRKVSSFQYFCIAVCPPAAISANASLSSGSCLSSSMRWRTSGRFQMAIDSCICFESAASASRSRAITSGLSLACSTSCLSCGFCSIASFTESGRSSIDARTCRPRRAARRLRLPAGVAYTVQ
mmetsp:Transcript_14078/g.51134  ORF Transcript_14078/g.51134 Transcript_14078/m.51134 type:complete len:222 (-) Transcript_14078:256-921(-)